MKKLSTLHWFVYSLIVENNHTSKNPIDQRTIYDFCKRANLKVTWNENPANHNCHARWLTKIVDELNSSMRVDKIIAHHGYRFYFCDYDEANQIVSLMEQKIIMANNRKWALKKKIRRHNQGKLLSNEGNPIDSKSHAKPFYETFLIEHETKEEKK